jgi:divalent metal cation (Fe/Co/Zn/Cd) transporter
VTATTGARLLRRGIRLEVATLGWNVVGTVVLVVLAVRAGSPALAGFGFDSLVEIAASLVVIWELTGTPGLREQRAMRLIGVAFVLLVVVIVAQVLVVLIAGRRPEPSPLGIAWTALTFVVMLLLATGKLRTGAQLGNPVLRTEGRVTLVDAGLAAAVLVGLAANALLGWWWADPAAGLVIVFYAAREARSALTHGPGGT